MSCATVRHCCQERSSLIKYGYRWCEQYQRDVAPTQKVFCELPKHTGTPYPAVTLMCRPRNIYDVEKYMKNTEANIRDYDASFPPVSTFVASASKRVKIHVIKG